MEIDVKANKEEFIPLLLPIIVAIDTTTAECELGIPPAPIIPNIVEFLIFDSSL